jgi:NADH-quinone oxidoreductase subunit L
MSVLYVLIVLLPLLAAICLALLGRRLGETSGTVASAAIGLSLVWSLAAFVEIALFGEPIHIPLYEFLRSGDRVVELGLYIDQLTVLMLLLVTGVSFVVHVYSARYMTGDPRYSRFFSVTTLFTFAMVTLVMSSNLLMLFMCWEIMGICSYLLISHQAHSRSACRAATKAFLVNAVADVGLLLGVILTFATFDTLDIRLILELAPEMSGHSVNLLGWAGLECHVGSLTAITLLLFMGCLGKSAQVPFHIWLPHAMEAPTPVSALIHAATMVNAGPFLLIRFSPLVMLSPAAMTVIAVIGGTTALFAAVVSLVQTDIKKILAYSTISQIGLMIMTCGVGAFAAAVFHLLAHGFLKGFLFLSTGSQLALAGSHGHTDSFSHTHRSRPPWSIYLGTLILACGPPVLLFAGPYESLWTAHNSGPARVAFWVIGLLTVFLTAIYLFRGISSLFASKPSALVQPRFSSPLHLLAITVAALGLAGLLLAIWNWFVPFLAPALAKPYSSTAGSPAPEILSASLALPLLAAVAGWAVACLLQARQGKLHAVPPARFKKMYVVLLNKLYFDEIFDACAVRPTLRFARWMWQTVEIRRIDRLVHAVATTSVGLARWLWEAVDVRLIDRAVEGTGRQSAGLARWLWEAVDVRRIEQNVERIGHAAAATGRRIEDSGPRSLQHHLLVLIFWLVTAIGLFYWLVL